MNVLALSLYFQVHKLEEKEETLCPADCSMHIMYNSKTGSSAVGFCANLKYANFKYCNVKALMKSCIMRKIVNNANHQIIFCCLFVELCCA